MEKKDHEFCLRCGRKLKNPQARELGYGAICYKKQQVEWSRKLFGPPNSKGDSEAGTVGADVPDHDS